MAKPIVGLEGSVDHAHGLEWCHAVRLYEQDLLL